MENVEKEFERLGAIFKRARKESGKPRHEIEAELNTNNLISRIESPTGKGPTLQSLVLYAAAIGCRLTLEEIPVYWRPTHFRHKGVTLTLKGMKIRECQYNDGGVIFYLYETPYFKPDGLEDRDESRMLFERKFVERFTLLRQDRKNKCLFGMDVVELDWMEERIKRVTMPRRNKPKPARQA